MPDRKEKITSISGFDISYVRPDDDLTPFLISGVFCFVLRSDNSFLTIRNPRGRDIPGGHLENGEHPLRCIERECNEETGLLLSAERFIPFALVDVHNPDYPSSLMLFTFARLLTGEESNFLPNVAFESKELFLSEYTQLNYLELMDQLLNHLNTHAE